LDVMRLIWTTLNETVTFTVVTNEELTLLSTVLLEKLIVTQFVKKLSTFTKP